jgi:hypothetical protein
MVLTYRTDILLLRTSRAALLQVMAGDGLRVNFNLTHLVFPFIHRLLAILMNGVPLGKGTAKTDETVKTL